MIDLTQMNPDKLRDMSPDELEELSNDIRTFLVDSVTHLGGHLSSNLGVVEMSIALHRVFETPKDKIVWDVGHQAYVHKILTGRAEQFDTLRQKDGLCGFPRRSESIHDAFDTGHSSTSLSAAMGIAQAKKLRNEEGSVIAVIGDGALTGGMVYEALSHIGSTQTPMIIILNDNGMSIAPNVGAMHYHLSKLRAAAGYINIKKTISYKMPRVKRTLEKVKNSIKYMFLQSAFFEELGVKYLGAINGHDIHAMETILKRAKNFDVPIVIHACTTKGIGFEPAEEDPEKFHGIAPLSSDGEKMQTVVKRSNSTIFGQAVECLAEQNDDVVAITAAMPQGTGLNGFAKRFPERFYDVGIAEEHALTFAAGLATNGIRPFIGIYSTFMQRAYDQMLHDVCLQNLPVVVGIDRAGLVGEDGATHHGVYDIAYLSTMPNLVCCAPGSQQELEEMVNFAYHYNGPVSIRYPRTTLPIRLSEYDEVMLGKWTAESDKLGDIVVISLSDMLSTAQKVVENLRKKQYNANWVNARFVKPLDTELLLSLLDCELVVVIEDGIATGGLGQQVAAFLAQYNAVKVKCFALPDEPVEHGNIKTLLQDVGLDEQSITLEIEKIMTVQKRWTVH